MSYDDWKASEPDREPASGEHRPYDDECDCDGCDGETTDDECPYCDHGCCACSPLVECPSGEHCPHGGM